MGTKRAGDEPYMMAATLAEIPVVVGRKRYDVGMIAVREFQPDVVVLDDAFQHMGLARDVDLVLLDSLRPFGNGYLFPRGPLREPVSGLLRGDAFILSRSDSNDPATFERIKKTVAPRPVFKSIHIPKISRMIDRKSKTLQQPNDYGFESLRTRRIFGFSGIAKNDDFKTMLVELGLNVRGFKRFPDHHYYSEEELAMIMELSRQAHCDTLVTTEKDSVRISDRTRWPVDLVIIGIETSFGDDTGRFDQFVKSRLAALIEERVSN
jgi:tetraacyldisaccharide 4'-kinase